MNQNVFILGPGFSTFVRAAAIVCEEKAISYEIGTSYEGHTVKPCSPELLELHPFGKFPVLLHGERVLTETAAIGRYLDTAFGPPSLQGSNDWTRAQCDQWCQLITIYVDRFVVREFMLELAFPSGADGKPLLDKVEAGRANADMALAVVARQLMDQPFLLGSEFSLADALLLPILGYTLQLPEPFNLLTNHQPLTRYTQRLLQRASVMRVLQSA